MDKPLVKAMLFTLGEKGYAWIVTAEVDCWEFEPIGSTADKESVEWAEAAFGACTRSYRRLQAQYPAMDIVVGVDKCPIGRALDRMKL